MTRNEQTLTVLAATDRLNYDRACPSGVGWPMAVGRAVDSVLAQANIQANEEERAGMTERVNRMIK